MILHLFNYESHKNFSSAYFEKRFRNNSLQLRADTVPVLNDIFAGYFF